MPSRRRSWARLSGYRRERQRPPSRGEDTPTLVDLRRFPAPRELPSRRTGRRRDRREDGEREAAAASARQLMPSRRRGWAHQPAYRREDVERGPPQPGETTHAVPQPGPQVPARSAVFAVKFAGKPPSRQSFPPSADVCERYAGHCPSRRFCPRTWSIFEMGWGALTGMRIGGSRARLSSWNASPTAVDAVGDYTPRIGSLSPCDSSSSSCPSGWRAA